MCGIAGIVKNEALDPSVEARVLRMVHCLRHRGPDGQGVCVVAPEAVLGHTRLAIVDPARGAQPMLSPDGQVAVTFNGEIYGFRKFRDSTDYSYKTESDTEVLLAMYAQDGQAMLRRLPGMFAFAVWDNREKALFCARDRFGEKPFYYAFGEDGSFIFASEIKAILASGLLQPVLDMHSVAHFLQKSYVHPHRTIYSNVSVLPPGHFLVYREGKVVVQKYWGFPKPSGIIGLAEAGEELRRLLTNAVTKQLVADVPVSGFLSSGLDSTTIMAIAAEQKADLTAFSVDSGDASSEADIAERSAQRYGIRFRRLHVADFDPAAVLQEIIPLYDEPFADSSSIPTYLISKAAAEYTKVALTGDGGDELLGGYDFQYRTLLRFGESKAWGSNRESAFLAANILQKLRFRKAADNLRDLGDKMPFFWDCKESWQVLAGMRSTCSFSKLRQLLEPSGFAVEESHPAPRFERRFPMEDALFYDTETYMAGQILVKTDRASMANGLELRAPFLDVDLAEFALCLPASLKISRTSSKIVLKKAFESAWSEEVANNYKRGFGLPVDKWFQTDGFRALVGSYLERPDRKIRDFVRYSPSSNQGDTPASLKYNLLVLSMWMERNSFSFRSN